MNSERILRLISRAQPAELELSIEASSGLAILREKVHSWYEQFHLSVFRYAMRKTHNKETAEDITQETFLRLFRYLREERAVENPRAWLFTVANRLAIDAARNCGQFKNLDESAWDRIDNSMSSRQASPESRLMERERMDRLHHAVLNLTDLQRECLHLRAEGLRLREIAGVLDLSISTVADALRRASTKLGREFAKEESA